MHGMLNRSWDQALLLQGAMQLPWSYADIKPQIPVTVWPSKMHTTKTLPLSIIM